MRSQDEILSALKELREIIEHGQSDPTISSALFALQWVLGNRKNPFAKMLLSLRAIDRAMVRASN